MASPVGTNVSGSVSGAVPAGAPRWSQAELWAVAAVQVMRPVAPLLTTNRWGRGAVEPRGAESARASGLSVRTPPVGGPMSLSTLHCVIRSAAATTVPMDRYGDSPFQG